MLTIMLDIFSKPASLKAAMLAIIVVCTGCIEPTSTTDDASDTKLERPMVTRHATQYARVIVYEKDGEILTMTQFPGADNRLGDWHQANIVGYSPFIVTSSDFSMMDNVLSLKLRLPMGTPINLEVVSVDAAYRFAIPALDVDMQVDPSQPAITALEILDLTGYGGDMAIEYIITKAATAAADEQQSTDLIRMYTISDFNTWLQTADEAQ